MSIIGSNILAGASGQGGGYTIERSLRFRSSASAYLSRTPASAGNRKTWTWSGWVKRGSASSQLFQGYGGSLKQTAATFGNQFAVQFYNEAGGYNTVWSSSAVYRDYSAWYHVVIVCDTTQPSVSNMVKGYVNGVAVSLTATNYNVNAIPQNYDTYVNATNIHQIGLSGTGTYTDGYLTEVNFIDGQALDPSSFGEFDSVTGVWKPAKYTGTYGTNGFYLPFSDNTTTTTLAADASGNGNNWTPNNISLTSGVTYDSMTDTPTPYADGGNYAVLNPLDVSFGTTNVNTLSNGNLTATGPAAQGLSPSTICFSSGKWYFETTVTTLSSTTSAQYVAFRDSGNSAAYYAANGSVGGVSGSSGGSWSANDVIGLAVDKDAGTIEFFKNGVTQGNSRTISTNAAGNSYLQVSNYNGGVLNANFGQRPFAYTPPTGFKPLHTGNLPDSAIVDGSKYFDAVLYTGNGTSQSVTGVGFAPDFVWIKNRSSALNHNLSDRVRDANGWRYLESNTTSAEGYNSQVISALGSDGFSVGNASSTNGSGNSLVAWNWKANGAGVSNTDGSITSTVSANPTAGFSIVSFVNASGTNQATVGHGLGVAPKLIISKNRDTSANNWAVFHTSVCDTTSKFLKLNTTDATATYSTVWGASLPTSSVFGVTGGGIAAASVNIIAYCFAEVEGYSKFGSYTGNGSSDGVFVHLNFRPALVIIKRTDASGYSWNIYDSARDTYNPQSYELFANTADADAGSDADTDFLSNGFKLRRAGGGINASGGTYIYMAFAENPFKNSLAR